MQKSKNKDMIPGGLADKKTAKDFNPKSLTEGLKVEMEHTNNEAIAREITMDHLTEDPNYYKKLKTIEKQDRRVDKEKDGKQELDYGKEELDKEGEMDAAQSNNQDAQNDLDVRRKWKKLKKAMAEQAFMSIGTPEKEEEPEQEDQQDLGIPQEDIDSLIQQHLGGGEEAESDDGSSNESDEQGEDQELSDHEEEGDEQLDDEGVEDEETAEEMLQQLGYSDVEIAHIVHGHHFPDVDELKAAKADTERSKKEGELSLQQLEMQIKQGEHSLKSGHADIMNKLDADHKRKLYEMEQKHKARTLDLEHEKAKRAAAAEDDTDHKKRLRDIEYQKAQKTVPGDEPAPVDDSEHKKRMMDLEYEKAKRDMELDLEIKKRQAELKMKQMEEDAKVRAKEKIEDAKVRATEKKAESAKPEPKKK